MIRLRIVSISFKTDFKSKNFQLAAILRFLMNFLVKNKQPRSFLIRGYLVIYIQEIRFSPLAYIYPPCFLEEGLFADMTKCL